MAEGMGTKRLQGKNGSTRKNDKIFSTVLLMNYCSRDFAQVALFTKWCELTASVRKYRLLLV
jgi:hypothetical protein